MKSFKIIIPLLVVAMLLVLFGYAYSRVHPREALLSRAPEHGVCFTVQADIPRDQASQAIEDLKKVIRTRFWLFNTQIYWEPISQGEFRVYVPIVKKELLENASELVSRPGILDFRLVHPRSEDLISAGQIPDGYALLQLQEQPAHGIGQCIVSETSEMGNSGMRVRKAVAMKDAQNGNFEVQFKLTRQSAEAFRRLTRENIGGRLAVVLDGTLKSAPVIRAEIPSGSARISGEFDSAGAKQLAIVLEHPLPFPIRLLETKDY